MVLLFSQHEPLRHTIEEILRRDGIAVRRVVSRGEDARLLAGDERFRIAIVAYGWDPAQASEFAALLRARYPSLPLLSIDAPEPPPDQVLLRTPFGPSQLSEAVRRLLRA